MTTPNKNNPPRNSQRQRGAAILIMTLILMLGLITLFTFRMDRRGPELEADRKTAMALAQAKEALLGDSATNHITGGIENPGRLPCPNIHNNPTVEGNSSGLLGSNCQTSGAGIPSNMGRFPWRSLRVSDLRDGAAERLWYVIDPAFVDTGAPMSSLKSPSLAVNGNNVVAAIIAPGPALGALGQVRDTVNQGNNANYLESYGGALVINLNAPSDTYNDRILTVTARELFGVVTFRMARELAKVNVAYPLTVTTIAALTKPLVWDNNNWDGAVVGDGTTSNVNPSKITLKFINCAITYTITGPSNVSRDSNLC